MINRAHQVERRQISDLIVSLTSHQKSLFKSIDNTLVILASPWADKLSAESLILKVNRFYGLSCGKWAISFFANPHHPLLIQVFLIVRDYLLKAVWIDTCSAFRTLAKVRAFIGASGSIGLIKRISEIINRGLSYSGRKFGLISTVF